MKNTKNTFSKYHTTNGSNAPVTREFYDLDDAAAAVFGKGTAAGHKIDNLEKIKNQGVIDALQSLGYKASDFTPVQYLTHGPKGSNIMTVFEAEGGVYFGPHESSANW